ncbi:hypothetical protein GCM10023084_42360 [Streptomyces lacrimifluminis]|uniref:Uncharacterized protein n=1 Tax=Streptomyces lacrimifluminis TaxID=1500077 RepID=A0A917KHD0_9ACTN|nr:hypothetical protein GCM10012282_04950 [Streptomyces lacrimifluminis]
MAVRRTSVRSRARAAKRRSTSAQRPGDPAHPQPGGSSREQGQKQGQKETARRREDDLLREEDLHDENLDQSSTRPEPAGPQSSRPGSFASRPTPALRPAVAHAVDVTVRGGPPTRQDGKCATPPTGGPPQWGAAGS